MSKVSSRYVVVAGAFIAALLLYFGWLHRESGLDLKGIAGIQLRKSQLVAQMQTDLLASVDAEKSAILAGSEESSREFTTKAQTLSEKVELGRQELLQFRKEEPAGQEARLLDEFSAAWAEFRSVDKELLSLAVLNTNAKAYRISATQALQAFRDFEQALDETVRLSAQSKDIGPIAEHGFLAVAEVAKILAMQAPHIAEASDARMDEMERDMATSATAAQDALKAMRPLVAGQAVDALQKAVQAFSGFEAVNGEVVRLSRINSNVKALALSMGRKRRVAAQCEEILATLQGAITSRLSKATR